MDFGEALNLLFALQKVSPRINWYFDGEVLKVRGDFWCVEGTAKAFEDAKKMFEPI